MNKQIFRGSIDPLMRKGKNSFNIGDAKEVKCALAQLVSSSMYKRLMVMSIC
ncbi:uncharacterized protein PHALS_08490 [Plasmopara halstedii]|uniref:Uncharacterized protein n=1 Tax=Plasmopara halstedii TaxID=4781 RepID=A0A0P1AC05_PLAHL|nr:uncharacterized protein PHALS_08490 [Plasmopara halstedii]CEG38412.1 hypothetical protein PHALS_08490 [Plasmopara halstedii]|eukprot:XP_024574781.1 hypothetical protein PHALS_08490 [Plasmopara halstedii]